MGAGRQPHRLAKPRPDWLRVGGMRDEGRCHRCWLLVDVLLTGRCW